MTSQPVATLWNVRDAMARHPRIPRSVKAAVAAVLAWLVIQPLGGVADDYPYYAPLGAVIAVSSTVADSMRASVQGVLSILLGAGLAVIIGPLVPDLVALAVVVLLGTLVAGWWRLGEMSTWVPISALFVLIIGSGGWMHYVVGYIGLTGLGALVGVATNAVFPPLSLTPEARLITGVRTSLADQLDDLAGGLSADELPKRDEWLARHRDVRPGADVMKQAVSRSAEAQRVNWRARRWQLLADRQAAHARALERLSLVVDDLAILLADTESADRGSSALGPRLRGPAAAAMAAVATMLRDAEADDGTSSEESHAAADLAVQQFADAIFRRIGEGATDVLEAGAVVTALRRVIASLAPR